MQIKSARPGPFNVFTVVTERFRKTVLHQATANTPWCKNVRLKIHHGFISTKVFQHSEQQIKNEGGT